MAAATSGKKDHSPDDKDVKDKVQVKEEKVDWKEALVEDARMEFRKLIEEADVKYPNDYFAREAYVTRGLSNHFKILAEAYVGDKQAQGECMQEYMDSCNRELQTSIIRARYWLTMLLSDGLQHFRGCIKSAIWNPPISESQMLRYCFANAVRRGFYLLLGQSR